MMTLIISYLLFILWCEHNYVGTKKKKKKLKRDNTKLKVSLIGVDLFQFDKRNTLVVNRNF